MHNNIKLSPQDRTVMEVLWSKGEMTNTEVLKELGTENWTRHTVRAYLLRLKEKGLIEVKKISRKSQFYYPLITKDEYMASEAGDYLRNHFNGLTHMVAGLAFGKQVSNEELDELEQFLKEYKNEDK